MHRFIRRAGAVIAAVVFAVTAGVQSPALADNVTRSRLLDLGNQDFGYGTYVGDRWQVGDCHMETPSYVQIDGTLVRLKGLADTDFSHHGDYWHNRFDFLDGDYQLIVSVGAIEGSNFTSPVLSPGVNGGASPPVLWVATKSGLSGLAEARHVLWVSAC